MALLDKLTISGVRSFSHDNEEKIKFSTPLTLILGQNGCGKTTIIECVKYALTNVLPAGTGSGSGFVNDPQLSNKSYAKCSIKLRFRDSKGDYITVGKFGEVTVTRGSIKFKGIAPTIRYEKGDDPQHKEDISGRCADISSYCTQKLNVPKAILNNVIFCHQEDSAWPLDEGKKLKERFDQIFGATEYNKCVERFRKFIKELRNDVKVVEVELKHKELIKNNAENLQSSLNVGKEQLQTIEETITKREEDIEPLNREFEKICKIERELSNLSQNLKGLEKTYEALVKQQQNLREYIKEEFVGSDEDLQNKILNFNKNEKETLSLIGEMEGKKTKIEVSLREVSQELQNLQRNSGKMKADEERHKKTCEELDKSIEKGRIMLKVLADNVEEPSQSIEKLESAYKVEKENFAKLVAAKDMNAKQLQEKVSKIRDSLVAAKSSLASKKKATGEYETKISENKSKLSRFSLSHSQMTDVDQQITDVESSLTQIKSEFNEEVFQNELDDISRQITMKEREFKLLQQNYSTEQEIKKESAMVLEKRAEIEEIHRNHKTNFEKLFHNNIPKRHFQQAIKEIQRVQERKLKDADRDITVHDKRVSSLEADVKNTRELLESQREELKTKRNKIDAKCKGKIFNEVLNQSHGKKEKLQRDKGTYRSAKTFFDEFIVQFQQETPCCPVCETDFSDKKRMVPNIISRLKSRIEELPRKLTEVENELRKEETFYNELQQLKPVSDEISRLQTDEIPALESKLEKLEETLKETTMGLVALKEERKEPDTLVEISRRVITDAAVLDRLISDVEASESSLATLKRQLVQVFSKRSLHEVETDLTNLRRTEKTKRDLLNDCREQIQKFNQQYQTCIQKKLKIRQGMQEQPFIESQIKEFNQIIIDLEMECRELDESIQTLETKLSQAERERNQTVKDNNSQIEKTRADLEQHNILMADVRKLQASVTTYKSSDCESKLKELLKNIESNELNITKLQKAKKLLEEKIVSKKEEQASQETKLRELKDNLELRNKQKEVEELKKEIESLNKQIGGYNAKSVVEDKRRVIGQIDSITREISEKNGEKRQLKEKVDEIQSKLNLKEHREAATQHRKKFYQCKMKQRTLSDMENYTSALENSLLKFHKQKMRHINMSIRDLWRNIYKGNDIDYIEIQAEDNVSRMSSRKRNYEYKVVQVKKGVALEMRGRCSAGQKVLACLVIRMALAETFSANCGILALDEPTTNLDRENIGSLCDALSKIISTREKNSGFQLLIITHDEDFLQMLTRNQSVSHYYKVLRNSDGYSQIKKEIL